MGAHSPCEKGDCPLQCAEEGIPQDMPERMRMAMLKNRDCHTPKVCKKEECHRG